MCLVRVSGDDEDAVYIRRVRRPVRSKTRITYPPVETRTRVSQTYITKAPRPKYMVEDRPRGQYLVGPPQRVGGAQIHQSAPISREPPKPDIRPPPPPPAPIPPPPPSPPEIVKEKETIVEKKVKEKEGDETVVEKKVEKKVETKVEKSSPPLRPAETQTRLEVVSVEHSDPSHPPPRSHSSISRKHSRSHSRHNSRASSIGASTSHRRVEHDSGIIVEREREIERRTSSQRRYLVDHHPARRSEPEYDTYRYIEAPPQASPPLVAVKKEVRYLEDNPRREMGGFLRERERERVVVAGDGRRRRDYFR